MRDHDLCRCPGEHRLVLDGTCWRCLGRVEPRPGSDLGALVGRSASSSG